MAMKIDQDAVFKYADKVFLALAGAFLIFAIVMLVVGGKKPEVAYDSVADALDRAKAKQSQAHVDQYLVGVKDQASLPEEQRAVVALVQTTPYFRKELPGEIARYPEIADRSFLPEVDYSTDFLRKHDALPQQWVSAEDRRVPQKAPIMGKGEVREPYRIPPLEDKDGRPKRIAPTELKVVSDKGYVGTGRERDGDLGTDYFYNSGQFKLDISQQVAWIREHAKGLAINDVVFTGVEVQRRDVQSDGSYGPWKDIKPADVETVKKEVLIPLRPNPEDLDPKVLDADERRRRAVIDAVTRRMRAVWQKRQADILRPPFYAMTGKEWLQPYEILNYDVDAGASGPATGGAAEGGATETGFLDLDKLAASDGTTKPTKKIEVEGWFNDVLAKDDLGRTFQYRVRVKMFNPLFGAPADQAVADERFVIEVPCRWSEPSAAVTADSPVRFFFNSRAQMAGSDPKASVDMFRWIHGKWYQAKAVQFEIGSPIAFSRVYDIEVPDKRGWVVAGRARVDFVAPATVVDVAEATTIYSGREQRVSKLVYSMDGDDGRLYSRIDMEDRDRKGQFEKDRKAEEDQLKTVRRRTIRDTRGPVGDEEPPPEEMPEPIPPEEPPPGWGQR
ncbi:MAG TPA: hypothetical protein PLP01_06795 [Phycisphaerae bacterium]|nr:hypothetical protein [Phycisphaerae bacterium]HOI54940.1 hypothetical protein [Phycisphaerae bacterium]